MYKTYCMSVCQQSKQILMKLKQDSYELDFKRIAIFMLAYIRQKHLGKKEASETVCNSEI